MYLQKMKYTYERIYPPTIFYLALIVPICFGYVIHYEEQPRIDLHETLQPNVCDTVECQTSDFISRNLNFSVDPCEDFYEYACGGWIKDNPVPPTQSHKNQFHLAEERLQAQIKEILKKDDTNSPLPVRAASLYYRSCINSERIENEGMSLLVKFQADFAGWPMTQQNWDKNKFSWLKLTADSMRRLSVPSLMYISVGLDRLDSNRSVILIDQATLVLPRSMLTDPKAYTVQLEAYRQWIGASAMLISKHLNESVPVEMIEKRALNIVEFEIEIAKITSTNEMRRNALRMYNNMTLRSLQEWTDSASPTFKIDWLTIVRDVFSGTGINIDYNERVVVKELDFFFHLAVLLQNTPTETLADYLHWRVVRALSQDLTDEMRTLVSQFDEVYSGIIQNEPRWRDCLVSVTNVMSFAVGYAYVKEHFDEETKIMAKDMVNNILAAFSHQLKNAEWMDESTKSSAIDKVNSMTLFIGYPEWYHNVSALYAYYDGLSVGASHFVNVEQVRTYLYKQSLMKLKEKTDRNEWITGPAIVNAFNNGYTNSIILPAGMLQLPFFDTKRIMAMNYGSIGAVIGHEILHSFDDTGLHNIIWRAIILLVFPTLLLDTLIRDRRLTDKFGNLAQWWTENVITTYEKKTQCFIDQYSKFIVPIIEDVNQTTTFSVNGIYTQGENIADNSGLRQAFFAYEKYVRDNGEEKPLHGVRQFSPEQLFFISYAMAWCESNTKQSLMQEVLNDPHSPHKVRVIGTLSNSPEFASTFKCPKNSPMNPEDKCIIW